MKVRLKGGEIVEAEPLEDTNTVEKENSHCFSVNCPFHKKESCEEFELRRETPKVPEKLNINPHDEKTKDFALILASKIDQIITYLKAHE